MLKERVWPGQSKKTSEIVFTWCMLQSLLPDSYLQFLQRLNDGLYSTSHKLFLCFSLGHQAKTIKCLILPIQAHLRTYSTVAEVQTREFRILSVLFHICPLWHITYPLNDLLFSYLKWISKVWSRWMKIWEALFTWELLSTVCARCSWVPGSAGHPHRACLLTERSNPLGKAGSGNCSKEK